MKELYCITCPAGCHLKITGVMPEIYVEGNKCPKGHEFAEHEMSNPTRTLTTTVRTNFPDVPVISVRTDGEIPKDMMMDAMQELCDVVVTEELGVGDTVLEDVAQTGVRVIITSSALMQLGAELENTNAKLGKSALSDDAEISLFDGNGVGAVRNSDALDNLSMEAAGGFIGAAGEAVGVESVEQDETAEDESTTDESNKKQTGRSHITRRG